MKTTARILNFATAGAVAFILLCGSTGAQTMKEMPQRAVKPNAAVEPVYKGKISGFVYWDTTKVESILLYDPCAYGIQTIQASRIISVTPVMNLSGQFGATLNASKPYSGSFGSCAYTIDNVPVDQPLLVIASLRDGIFVSKTNRNDDGFPGPAPGEKGFVGNFFDAGVVVTVASIPCRDFASIESPTNSTSGLRSCSAQATNVNFVIEPYSDLKSFIGEGMGSVQQLTVAQAKAVAQAARLQQKPISGPLTPQSASSTGGGASGQRAPISPANTTLGSPGSAQTPMLGTPAQPLLANGVQPGKLASQPSGTTNATLASGVGTTSAAGARAAPAQITPPNSGSQAGPPPVPAKGKEHSAYEAVTVQRGTTSDPNFTNWARSGQGTNSRESSQLLAARAPAPALTPALVAAACAKDPSLRILGISGSSEPITFVSGHTYTIWGCSFGSENPNNAVYLSDGGLPGSAFIWYLQKISWGANSVVVQVSTAPSSARSNLMLFVLGQNGNTKLNGIALKP